ncbi:MAG: homocysteine S-methyltransferase family protein [Candidatus Aureabacteria bacterium]|nr:homocysteine S-methyltransferase family protein [Candidatus Auribacterota bacterium]
MKKFLEMLKERVLLCDGAMGTMLQKGGLPAGACPEEAVLSRPDLILDIHQQYVAAGAEIIETNSFGADRYKLSEYGLDKEVERINREAARLARKASRGKAYVAGSVGPLGKQIAPLGEIRFDQAVDAFREQMKALARGGVDLIILETIADIREARAALLAARDISALPVVALMTFSEGMRTFAGTPPEVAAVVLNSMGAVAVGANCSVGPEEMFPVLEKMAVVTDAHLCVMPNAGLPEIVNGRTVFKKSPGEMAAYAERFVKLGVTIIGGCCGTTPEHIHAMSSALVRRRPVPRKPAHRLRLCSRTRMVELHAEAAPMVIGERINLSVRNALACAFLSDDTTAVRDVAQAQVRQGAHLLDLNVGIEGEALGVGKVSEAQLMKKMVHLIQRTVDVPLVIDSADPSVIEAGLRASNGRPLINSISADKEKMLSLLTLARVYGAAVVLLPVSGKGIPQTAAKRVKLAEELRASAMRMGIASEDILIDPLVMAASSSPEQVAVTLETLRLMKERGYQVVMGLSNVSFGLPERSIMNATFLSMAMGIGLDAVILNPGDERVMNTLRAARVLTAADRGAKEFVLQTRAVPSTGPPAATARGGTPEAIQQKLLEAILAGDKDGVIPLLEEALARGISALDINISMITPSLEEVGRRFEGKEIFLPQMILSSEAVQHAFTRLKREMKGGRMPSCGKIVMATVRGDVHDIGKNICCTILENYGYEVIDLGRNVPADEIADKAAAVKADIVGLSALMTTTMRQMEQVIAELAKRGLKPKVMVGGAVVTAAYARKIGADGYAKSAGEIARLVKRLMGEKCEQDRPVASSQ